MGLYVQYINIEHMRQSQQKETHLKNYVPYSNTFHIFYLIQQPFLLRETEFRFISRSYVYDLIMANKTRPIRPHWINHTEFIIRTYKRQSLKPFKLFYCQHVKPSTLERRDEVLQADSVHQYRGPMVFPQHTD